jgi:hypothetical protein
MIQTFPNDAVFQDDNAPIHIAETVQSWFEEHEKTSSLANTIIRHEHH